MISTATYIYGANSHKYILNPQPLQVHIQGLQYPSTVCLMHPFKLSMSHTEVGSFSLLSALQWFPGAFRKRL